MTLQLTELWKLFNKLQQQQKKMRNYKIYFKLNFENKFQWVRNVTLTWGNKANNCIDIYKKNDGS